MESSPQEPIVATLQFRGGELTLSSTPLGVRYALRDGAGRTRAHLTLAELQAYDPELYRLANEATADTQLMADLMADR